MTDTNGDRKDRIQHEETERIEEEAQEVNGRSVGRLLLEVRRIKDEPDYYPLIERFVNI